MLVPFDLYRRVINLEPIVKHRARIMQEGISRATVGHDQVAGQSDLGGAHRPDVQIVEAGHAG